MKKIYSGIAVCLVALICFFLFKKTKSPELEANNDQPTEGVQSDGSETVVLNLKSPDGKAVVEDFSGDYMSDYGDPQKTIDNDLIILVDLLDSFNSFLKGRTTLSTGTNQDLVKILLGNNTDRIRFISADSKALNEKKELIDRWGTPLFFHFQNQTMPEIRSAGPDQKMWTDDDTVLDIYANQ